MNRVRFAIAFCAVCGMAAAQDRLRPKKDDVDLPIPITSPRAVLPGTIEPLTPKEKVTRALRNTFSPRALANRALIAGWSQLWDSPEEWGGDIEGYGQRFGARMGRLAVRQGVQLGTDLAFRIDPRFDRCNCETFKSRTAHAWKRVFVARRDDGSEIVNVSSFAGAYIPPMLTAQWYPDSYNTWGQKLTSGSQFLLMRGATNMLREFWPDISRKFRLTRFKAGD